MTRQEELNAVKQLGEVIGYGNMMEIASDLWKQMLLEKHNLKTGYFVPALEVNGQLHTTKENNG